MTRPAFQVVSAPALGCLSVPSPWTGAVPPPALDLDDVVRLAESAGLRGRGGAGFPLARKLRAVAAKRRRPVVAVNAAEGEPASGKDAALAAHLPAPGARRGRDPGPCPRHAGCPGVGTRSRPCGHGRPRGCRAVALRSPSTVDPGDPRPRPVRRGRVLGRGARPVRARSGAARRRPPHVGHWRRRPTDAAPQRRDRRAARPTGVRPADDPPRDRPRRGRRPRRGGGRRRVLAPDRARGRRGAGGTRACLRPGRLPR